MNKKTIKILIALIVSIAAYSYVIYKGIEFKNQFSSFQITDYLNLNSLPLMLSVVILAFCNWSVEAFKWKLLMQPIQKIAFARSFKAILAGITAGMLTPNRIGAIAGRTIVVKKDNIVKSMIATSFGGIAQLITTILVGSITLILFFLNHSNEAFALQTYIWILTIIIVACLPLLLYSYIKPQLFTNLIRNKTHRKKLQSLLKFHKELPSSILISVLFISIIRYTIFFFQYFLLLILFKVDIPLYHAFIAIGLQYLLMTTIPSITLSELGVRGSLSIILIGMFSYNVLGILMATTSLWLINIATPGLIGTTFYFKY